MDERVKYLKKTAEYLLTAEGHKTAYGNFDMSVWWDDCGTKGCFIGHMVKMFPECGLSLKKRLDDHHTLLDRKTGYVNFEGLCQWLDGVLIGDEVRDLFDSESYDGLDPSPAEVAGNVLLYLIADELVTTPADML